MQLHSLLVHMAEGQVCIDVVPMEQEPGRFMKGPTYHM